MNTILLESEKMPYHTYLRPILEAFKGRQKEFNWYITNLECYFLQGKAQDWFGKDTVWISGEQLTDVVYEHDTQFIWGNLFGFKKDIKYEDVIRNIQPYSKRKDPARSKKPQIEHPLATFEIVCFDSTFTILLSRDNDLSQRFRNYFKEAQDLNELKKSFRKRRKSSAPSR